MEFGQNKKRSISLTKKILAKVKYLFFAIFPRKYTTSNDCCKKKIYVSYIVPFNKLGDPKYVKSHQNIRETLLMPQIFNSIGYNCYFGEFNRGFRKGKYEATFGIEPNFEKQSQNNPLAKKIYYATGAYFKHQNWMIKMRTDALNSKYGTSVSYSRLVNEHRSTEIADYIIQIGSSYTVSTYPIDIQSKIICIDQSFIVPKCIDQFVKAEGEILRTNYIWFGSSGSVLKGIDLVLEAFSKNKDLQLHVIGPIDDDFSNQILPFFNNCENIHFYGYLSVDDDLFKQIVSICGFCIYPSVSEGCPGSVLTMMSLQTIPIVSRYSAFDGFEDLGYILDDITVEDINSKIEITQSLSISDVRDKAKAISEYVLNRFTIEKYEQQMKCIFNKLLN